MLRSSDPSKKYRWGHYATNLAVAGSTLLGTLLTIKLHQANPPPLMVSTTGYGNMTFITRILTGALAANDPIAKSKADLAIAYFQNQESRPAFSQALGMPLADQLPAIQQQATMVSHRV